MSKGHATTRLKPETKAAVQNPNKYNFASKRFSVAFPWAISAALAFLVMYGRRMTLPPSLHEHIVLIQGWLAKAYYGAHWSYTLSYSFFKKKSGYYVLELLKVLLQDQDN